MKIKYSTVFICLTYVCTVGSLIFDRPEDQYVIDYTWFNISGVLGILAGGFAIVAGITYFKERR